MRCLESWYVGEDTNDTVGLTGFLVYGFWGGHTKGGCVQLNSKDGRKVVGNVVESSERQEEGVHASLECSHRSFAMGS